MYIDQKSFARWKFSVWISFDIPTGVEILTIMTVKWSRFSTYHAFVPHVSLIKNKLAAVSSSRTNLVSAPLETFAPSPLLLYSYVIVNPQTALCSLEGIWNPFLIREEASQWFGDWGSGGGRGVIVQSNHSSFLVKIKWRLLAGGPENV